MSAVLCSVVNDDTGIVDSVAVLLPSHWLVPLIE